MKQGQRRKNWKQRLVTVTLDGIKYFEPDKRAEKGGVQFEEGAPVQVEPLPSDNGGPGEWHFQVVVQSRNMQFYTTSEAEMNEWVQAIRKAATIVGAADYDYASVEKQQAAAEPMVQPKSRPSSASALLRPQSFTAGGTARRNSSRHHRASTVRLGRTATKPAIRALQEEAEAEYEGELMIRRRGGSWKRRWVVLQGTGVHVYRSNKQKELKGHFDITNFSFSRVAAETRGKVSGMQGVQQLHTIVMIPPPKEYRVYAVQEEDEQEASKAGLYAKNWASLNETECREWVEALEGAVARGLEDQDRDGDDAEGKTRKFTRFSAGGTVKRSSGGGSVSTWGKGRGSTGGSQQNTNNASPPSKVRLSCDIFVPHATFGFMRCGRCFVSKQRHFRFQELGLECELALEGELMMPQQTQQPMEGHRGSAMAASDPAPAVGTGTLHWRPRTVKLTGTRLTYIEDGGGTGEAQGSKSQKQQSERHIDLDLHCELAVQTSGAGGGANNDGDNLIAPGSRQRQASLTKLLGVGLPAAGAQAITAPGATRRGSSKPVLEKGSKGAGGRRMSKKGAAVNEKPPEDRYKYRFSVTTASGEVKLFGCGSLMERKKWMDVLKEAQQFVFQVQQRRLEVAEEKEAKLMQALEKGAAVAPPDGSGGSSISSVDSSASLTSVNSSSTISAFTVPTEDQLRKAQQQVAALRARATEVPAVQQLEDVTKLGRLKARFETGGEREVHKFLHKRGNLRNLLTLLQRVQAAATVARNEAAMVVGTIRSLADVEAGLEALIVGDYHYVEEQGIFRGIFSTVLRTALACGVPEAITDALELLTAAALFSDEGFGCAQSAIDTLGLGEDEDGQDGMDEDDVDDEDDEMRQGVGDAGDEEMDGYGEERRIRTCRRKKNRQQQSRFRELVLLLRDPDPKGGSAAKIWVPRACKVAAMALFTVCTAPLVVPRLDERMRCHAELKAAGLGGALSELRRVAEEYIEKQSAALARIHNIKIRHEHKERYATEPPAQVATQDAVAPISKPAAVAGAGIGAARRNRERKSLTGGDATQPAAANGAATSSTEGPEFWPSDWVRKLEKENFFENPMMDSDVDLLDAIMEKKRKSSRAPGEVQGAADSDVQFGKVYSGNDPSAEVSFINPMTLKLEGEIMEREQLLEMISDFEDQLREDETETELFFHSGDAEAVLGQIDRELVQAPPLLYDEAIELLGRAAKAVHTAREGIDIDRGSQWYDEPEDGQLVKKKGKKERRRQLVERVGAMLQDVEMYSKMAQQLLGSSGAQKQWLEEELEEDEEEVSEYRMSIGSSVGFGSSSGFGGGLEALFPEVAAESALEARKAAAERALKGMFKRFATGVDKETSESAMAQADLVVLCKECDVMDSTMTAKIFMMVRLPKKACLRYGQFQTAWHKIGAAKGVTYEQLVWTANEALATAASDAGAPATTGAGAGGANGAQTIANGGKAASGGDSGDGNSGGSSGVGGATARSTGNGNGDGTGSASSGDGTDGDGGAAGGEKPAAAKPNKRGSIARMVSRGSMVGGKAVGAGLNAAGGLQAMLAKRMGGPPPAAAQQEWSQAPDGRVDASDIDSAAEPFKACIATAGSRGIKLALATPSSSADVPAPPPLPVDRFPEVLQALAAASRPAGGGWLKAATIGNDWLAKARNKQAEEEEETWDGPAPAQDMQPLFWTKLPKQEFSGSFWEVELQKYQKTKEEGGEGGEGGDTGLALALKDAHGKELEAAFAKAQPKKVDVQTNARGSVGGASTGKKEKKVKKLLDPRRAQNVQITRKKVLQQMQPRLTDLELAVAISTCDLQRLDRKRTELLEHVLPTSDEAFTLRAYDDERKKAGDAAEGEEEELAEAEGLMLALLSVPRLSKKMKCLMLRFEAADVLQRLSRSCTMVQTASAEAEASSCLHDLLLLVLQVGNFLNHGTRRGRARGVSVMDLEKLELVRSKNPAMGQTLLHCVCRIAHRERPRIAQELKAELAAVAKAARVDASQLQREVSQFSADVEIMKNEVLLAAAAGGETGERGKEKTAEGATAGSEPKIREAAFAKTLEPFVGEYMGKVAELVDLHNSVKKKGSEVLSKYGEEEGSSLQEWLRKLSQVSIRTDHLS
jgi:hypothetical protein